MSESLITGTRVFDSLPAEALIDQLGDPVACCSRSGELFLVNRVFCETFGADPLTNPGAPLESILGDPDVTSDLIAAFGMLEAGKIAEIELALPTPDRKRREYRLRYGVAGGDSAVVLHFLDITEDKRIYERLSLLEYRDRRTGLPNRRALDLVLDKEISRIERSASNELLAVLFISLENIARINQTHGHEVGDIILENSGIRIRESIITELLRESDFLFTDYEVEAKLIDENDPERIDEDHLVFRFDGRELTALLTGVSRETDAAVVAMRISRAVSVPYRDKFGSEIYVQCNIGIAIFPNDGHDRGTLIQHAASAMHEARRLEEDFLLFNKALHVRAMENMRLSGGLYFAFIESQFEMHFQPIVDYLGEIVGAEALIRWHHPEQGIVFPGQFIPLAEEKGIIVSIGKWALYNVCDQLAKWPDDIYVSVNLTPKEFVHADLIDNVRRVLERSSIDPRRLKVEITEQDAMRNPEDTIRRMQLLTDMGIDILIDDFGVGNSSLSYLKTLPAATLKIDRSFVSHIDESEEERTFLENIIELVQGRSKKVIVEGVETERQVALIRQMKPVLFQGYYFSRPIPAPEYERLITTRTRLPAE